MKKLNVLAVSVAATMLVTCAGPAAAEKLDSWKLQARCTVWAEMAGKPASVVQLHDDNTMYKIAQMNFDVESSALDGIYAEHQYQKGYSLGAVDGLQFGKDQTKVEVADFIYTAMCLDL